MIAATTLGTSPDAHAGDEQFPPQSGAGLSGDKQEDPGNTG